MYSKAVGRATRHQASLHHMIGQHRCQEVKQLEAEEKTTAIYTATAIRSAGTNEAACIQVTYLGGQRAAPPAPPCVQCT